MNLMVKKSIIWLIFVIGIIVFFYPILSNWLSVKEQHSVIREHDDTMQKLTEDEKVSERKKAQAYNDALDEQAFPVSDPFLSEDVPQENGGYYNVLDLGEIIGSIEIPAIDVNLPIYHGVSDEVLQRGVGHMSNSSFPVGGLNTHTALTGHRGLPSSKLFRNLDELAIGDTFYLEVLDEKLGYKIDDIQIVLPTETSWLEMKEDKDYVTLITCEPYMINTHRLLVRGERIDLDEEEEIASNLAKDRLETRKSNWKLFILIVSGMMVIIYLLYWFKGRRRI